MFIFKNLTMLVLTLLTLFTLPLASPLRPRKEVALDSDGAIWARSIESNLNNEAAKISLTELTDGPIWARGIEQSHLLDILQEARQVPGFDGTQISETYGPDKRQVYPPPPGFDATQISETYGHDKRQVYPPPPGFDATQISETHYPKKRQGLDGTQISETFSGPGAAGEQAGSNGGAISFGHTSHTHRSEPVEAEQVKAAEPQLAERQGLDATQISETFGYNAAGRTEVMDAVTMLIMATVGAVVALVL